MSRKRQLLFFALAALLAFAAPAGARLGHRGSPHKRHRHHAAVHGGAAKPRAHNGNGNGNSNGNGNANSGNSNAGGNGNGNAGGNGNGNGNGAGNGNGNSNAGGNGAGNGNGNSNAGGNGNGNGNAGGNGNGNGNGNSSSAPNGNGNAGGNGNGNPSPGANGNAGGNGSNGNGNGDSGPNSSHSQSGDGASGDGSSGHGSGAGDSANAKNAAQTCKDYRDSDPEGFAQSYGSAANAYGKCVSTKAQWLDSGRPDPPQLASLHDELVTVQSNYTAANQAYDRALAAGQHAEADYQLGLMVYYWNGAVRVAGEIHAFEAQQEQAYAADHPQGAGDVALGQAALSLAGGRVLVKRPGSESFKPLTDPTHIPTGSVVDARRGRVELTTAYDHSGRTQTGTFWGGVFEVRQTRGARPITELILRSGDFSSCPRTRARSASASATASRTRFVRRLWGRDRHGRFRTRGRYSATTVRGTTWLVADTCTGTLTTVTSGRVVVDDFARHKSVNLRAPDEYFAHR